VTRPDAVGETLLRAAGEVLAQHGPGALTVRRIAAEAGVSTMNVYSRFGGKDGVVEHLFVEGFSRLRDEMDVEPTDDPLDDLRRCSLAYRRFALANPTYYAVMFEGVVPDFVASAAAIDHASGTLGLLAEQVERAMSAGALVARDPWEVAAVLWATCHGVVSLEMKAVGPDRVRWASVYGLTCASVLAGLRDGA
jgi:AcrR family transcriptional regulator